MSFCCFFNHTWQKRSLVLLVHQSWENSWAALSTFTGSLGGSLIIWKQKTFLNTVNVVERCPGFLLSTCVFFGGSVVLETLFRSLWTSENIWFRLSTFSRFPALICGDTFYTWAWKRKERGQFKTTNSRVWGRWWPPWLCASSSSACWPLGRRFSFFSPFVCSSPCSLSGDISFKQGFYFEGQPSGQKTPNQIGLLSTTQ